LFCSPTFPQERNESLGEISRETEAISTVTIGLTDIELKRIWRCLESQGKLAVLIGKNATLKQKRQPLGPPFERSEKESVGTES